MTESPRKNPSDQHPDFLREYEQLKNLNLSLDMTRGKPSAAQLDLSNALLSLPGDSYLDPAGTDTRNYGGLDGLPDMKAFFAGILDVSPVNVIVGGFSSLTMMYDAIARACQFGVVDGSTPWNEVRDRKFICITPGYDRHFLITEHLGFELVSVDMLDSGPDMDQVEELVAADDTIKGIWCVPKYSNPTGTCYDERTIRRLAAMPAAPDFRIMWDNAYAEHHFTDQRPALADISAHCDTAGNPNRVLQYASTSKITHPGSGVAAMASSPANVADALVHINVQSIGPDKVNQLRHLKLFGDIDGLRNHMSKHADLLRPKFDRVRDILGEELGPLSVAAWTEPAGGYFISLDAPEGCAIEVIRLAAEAGVKLTSAGAPFPYGKDPYDRNIRIAPTLPPLEEVDQASRVLAACVKVVACKPD